MENEFLQQAFIVWDLQVSRVQKIIDALSDEQLMREITKDKNTGWYALGHVIAVNDAISEVIGTGKRAFPELHAPFVQHPDRSGFSGPSIAQLRDYFNIVHTRLRSEFIGLDAKAWLSRHNAITDDEFIANPSRNKLNILLNRTNHLSFHLGQLRLLF